MEPLTAHSALPANVHQSAYQPAQHGVGIVHFGPGAFHRAHMAVYTDDVLSQEGGDWRITGVSLRSRAVRDRLAPQHYRYTLVERGESAEKLRVIDCIKDILVASENPQAVLQRLVDPGVQIVSMTITEKGYLCDPATGRLMNRHADILHDLENPQAPRTIYGFLTEALARRRHLNRPLLTLLCCDNLPENGRVLKRALCDFAGQRDAALAAWIRAEIACPCTMVDRIVPATTEADIEATAATLGYYDAAPVVSEPFCQWVIEDRFSSSRPAWEKFGVTYVEDVAPYEEMKLRLLNGAHSAMAYLGYLGGIETIDRVIAEPAYLDFVKRMMQEAQATLKMPEDVDVASYAAALLRRFRNPALKHRTWQIAMDGSLKIPQRLLNSIRAHIFAGTAYPCLAIALAGWLRYVTGIDEQGDAIAVSDPYAEKLAGIAARRQGDATGYVREILQIEEIFGTDLAADEEFYLTIVAMLEKLFRHGARTAITLI